MTNSTGSTAAAPPPASASGPKSAKDMTPAELAEFEKKHGIRPRHSGRLIPLPRAEKPYWQSPKPTR